MSSQRPQREFSFSHRDEGALQPTHRRPDHDYTQQYRADGPQSSPVESAMYPPLRDYAISPPSPPPHQTHRTSYSNGPFDQHQTQRQYGVPSGTAGFGYPQSHMQTASSVPHPYQQQSTAPVPPTRASFTTPAMDNVGETSTGGGMAGLATSVANTKERASGLHALRDLDNWGRSGPGGGLSGPAERRFEPDEDGPPYGPPPVHSRPAPSYGSSSSSVPPAGVAVLPALPAPSLNYSNRSLALDNYSLSDRYSNGHGSLYSDNPYSNNRFETSRDRLATGMAAIDPMEIEDDGDDGISQKVPPRRKSMLGLGRPHSRGNVLPVAAGGAAGGAAANTVLSNLGHQNSSGQYNSVPGGAGSAASNSIEKDNSEWLTRQTRGNKRLRWIVGTVAAIVALAIIAGAVIGGVLGTRHSSSSPSPTGQSAADDDGKGDLSSSSAEIKALLNNPRLHKVFPGMDYTPLHAQYPACLTSPPSQNNVTRDMAVLSQLTNAVRLYGTDCNQTEMVLHAIDRLELKDMRVWLGVWLGNNDTTNTRQLSRAYSLLGERGADPFAGIIVGNEVLYRKDLTELELASVLQSVRSNLTARNLAALPLATSDLGDNWTPALAQQVDVVMSNIHPFFGGVAAPQAAAWTWNFWQAKDVPVTAGMTGKKHVIAETGWPSAGGNDCGTADGTCPDATSGSVAGIQEMNRFMGDWVCQALSNGTEYFWFEAFDEPWKIQFNTKTQNWEDKWGLMDVNRNLKPGVVIPDCGGKTV